MRAARRVHDNTGSRMTTAEVLGMRKPNVVFAGIATAGLVLSTVLAPTIASAAAPSPQSAAPAPSTSVVRQSTATPPSSTPIASSTTVRTTATTRARIDMPTTARPAVAKPTALSKPTAESSHAVRPAVGSNPGGSYLALAPTRLLDTRSGLGAAQGPLAGKSQLTLVVAGQAGVPTTGVSAVALNVTAIAPITAGYLTVYQSGVARPSASNLDFHAGANMANLTITQLGTDGAVDLYNGGTGSTQLVADIEGYYLAGTPSSSGAYVSLPTKRVLDTRGSGAIAAHGIATVHLDLPAQASAVALNVTAISPAADGYLTAFGTGSNRPGSSNLDFHPGFNTANLTVIPVAADDTVQLYNGSSGTVQLVADLSGYYLAGAATQSGMFTAVPIFRLLDTRSGFGGDRSALPGGGTISLQITGRAGVPTTGVTAAVVNVTAISPTSAGYLTSYPSFTAQAHVSDLDFAASRSVAALEVVPVGADGNVYIHNGGIGTVQLVADVAGYYTGISTPASFGAISGQVTDTSGHPLAHVQVPIQSLSGGYPAVQVYTDAAGRYLVPGVAADQWQVCYRSVTTGAILTSGGSSPFGYSTICDSGWLQVSIGAELTDSTVALTSAGAISGTVTDDLGHPLQGVKIDAAEDSNGIQDTGVRTAANGSYLISDLDALVPETICFDASTNLTRGSGAFLNQCYHGVDVAYGKPYTHQGDPVPVASGKLTAHIDAKLTRGAAIAGKITDPAGHPVAGVVVDAYPASGIAVTTTTASNGSYVFRGLPTGKYADCVFPSVSINAPQPVGQYTNQCYRLGYPFRAQNLSLTSGSLLANADMQLNLGGTISVRATDSAGDPLSNVAVYIDNFAPLVTPADGTVQLSWLAAGDHHVCFDGNTGAGGVSKVGYVQACYLNLPFGNPNNSGTSIAVTAGATTSITQKLAAAGGISVAVTDPDSNPITGITASATMQGANSGVTSPSASDTPGKLQLGR
jgi:hypothetical protein